MRLFPLSAEALSMSSGNSRKLRGGYYTPDVIARFLTSWAIRTKSDRVLEPSCGDGALVAQTADRLDESGEVVAVELFAEEAKKAMARAETRLTMVVGDVFEWWLSRDSEGSFDAVIGNPPFIRYQDFPEAHRDPAFELMRAQGLRPTRLANAWLPFVVLSTCALREGGRLALVLPAELMQVGYAAELREYLVRKFVDLHLITFRKILFEGTQQEVVLLLGQRRDTSSASISIEELNTADDLATLDLGQSTPTDVDLEHRSEKWTQYYLTNREVGLLRALADAPSTPRISDYGQVNVGIVTGRNDFFVISRPTAEALDVLELCEPMVGRSHQIPGLVLRPSDWTKLDVGGEKTRLLNVTNVDPRDVPDAALKYIQSGEELGYHEGYKCRIRLPAWWRVPSMWAPDAFMLRQIHDAPRIVSNDVGATCTDTIHRIRVKAGVAPRQLAAASVNSMTLAFAEVMGRSYGGGVLELEPREATALPFPQLNGELPINELDQLARSSQVEDVVDRVDQLVLKSMGLNDRDIVLLRGSWLRLSLRRRNRRRN